MNPRKPETKIVPSTRIQELSKSLKAQGKNIVTTNGCFDILHLGHIKYLLEAREMGDVLIVGINSDRSVKLLKGPSRPINPEHDRALQLAGLESVDYVTIFDESTPENLLKTIAPSIHIKGGDYTADKLPEKKIVEEGGGKVVCVSHLEGFSTTRLIDKMKID
jgi:glycerol-3-phosphate cytidylyltransferase